MMVRGSSGKETLNCLQAIVGNEVNHRSRDIMRAVARGDSGGSSLVVYFITKNGAADSSMSFPST